MIEFLSKSRNLGARLGCDRTGSVAIVFAVAAPVLLFICGAAIDYARNIGARASLQAIADSAALAGAKSLRLANANAQSVDQAVAGYVASQAGAAAPSIAVSTTLTTNNTVVAVQLTRTITTLVARWAGAGNMKVVVSAQARNAGSSLPLCVVALDPSHSQSLSVDIATLSAQGCQILSDSTAPDSVAISNGAVVKAGRLCSGGGAKQDSSSNYTPAPQTDCPPLPDPLASRAAPTVGGCTYTNLNIQSGSQSLSPGVYCGGLTLNGGVDITLLAGTHIMKDGQLTVMAGAKLSGTDVGIYLTGNKSTLNIQNNSTVNLAAPATGLMAGILIFEDRAAPLDRNHFFESRNAPNMLGTIYLPQGVLNIGKKGANGGSGAAVGATSAWTIIVAHMLAVTDNQQLMLNTNYSATNVPPPAGLGSNTTYGATTQLTQ